MELAAIWFAVKNGFGKAADFVINHPGLTYGVAATGLLAWLFVFTIPGLNADVLRLQKDLAETLKAEMIAYRAQVERNQEVQDQYDELAERIDDEYDAAKADAMADARAFIARNRVQNCPRTPTGGSDRAPETNPSGDLAAADSMSFLDGVVVPANDIEICTTNTLKALAAERYAAELGAIAGGGE